MEIPLQVEFAAVGRDEAATEKSFELMKALLAAGYSVRNRVAAVADAAGADDNVNVALRIGSGPGALDASALDAETVVARVEEVRTGRGLQPNGEWKPWFPVIDYDRCTHCMQCLSFCLFDVYNATPDKHLEVRNQDKCKTNCPACSRVCPEVAIMFPKYRSGPINGEEIKQEDVEREKMKIDVSALLGGDIYSMLRERHARAASRFSKERDEGKALKERMKCLQKLSDQLDIPPEVMMSLPSPDEIRRRADEAAEKARVARGEG